MGDGGVGSGSVDSGCHQLSENIWFVWSKMSNIGDMERCHVCGRNCICVFVFGFCGLKCHIVEILRDVTLVHDRRTECEDRARILETEFAMINLV